jgi:hypothetical protein
VSGRVLRCESDRGGGVEAPCEVSVVMPRREAAAMSHEAGKKRLPERTLHITRHMNFYLLSALTIRLVYTQQYLPPPD